MKSLVLFGIVLVIVAVSAIPVAPTAGELDPIRSEQQQVETIGEPDSVRATRSLVIGVGGVVPYAYPSA